MHAVFCKLTKVIASHAAQTAICNDSCLLVPSCVAFYVRYTFWIITFITYEWLVCIN